MKRNIKKRIVLIGGATNFGQRILREALRRGHNVIAVVDKIARVKFAHPSLELIEEDMVDDPEISKKLEGNDIMISALEPDQQNSAEYINVTQSVIEVTKDLGFKRLIATGHHPDHLISAKHTLSPRPVMNAEKQVLHLFEGQRNMIWSYLHIPVSQRVIHRHKAINAIRNKRNRMPVKSYASALLDEAERAG